VAEQVDPLTGDYSQETEDLACISEGRLCFQGFVERVKKMNCLLAS